MTEQGRDRVSTLRGLVDDWARDYPNDTWLISPDSGVKLTFSDVRRFCRHISSSISACGISFGSSVAIASPNSISSTIAFLATVYGGYRATPLNLVAGSKSINYVLGHSGARLLLLAEAAVPTIEAALSMETKPSAVETKPSAVETKPSASEAPALQSWKDGLKIVMMRSADNPDEWDWGGLASRDNDNLPATDFDGGEAGYATQATIDADTIGLLLYTSGTTGNPKGVLLTNVNLIAAGSNVALAHRLTREDIGLCVLPTYHINGLCASVMGTLVSGGGLVMASRFSTQAFWQQVSDFRCTWSSLVPTLFSYLLNDEATASPETNSLRFLRSASAPLAPETHRLFEKRFSIPIIETMGLTETGSQILSNPYPLPNDERKIGSAGIAYGNEIMIGDRSGRAVGVDVEGEILVRGANVMSGYLNNPKATKEAFTSAGWLRTGDLGRMDSDGYVFVTGRLKELIIKGGENIAPREVDEALLLHSDVLEAAAFACPCSQYGQRVEACVILRDRVASEVSCEDDPSKSSKELEAELVEHCLTALGKFKSPDRIHIVEKMPKGPSGKVQRLQLLSMLEGRD